MTKKIFAILVIILTLSTISIGAKVPVKPTYTIPLVQLSDTLTVVFEDSVIHPNYMFIPIIFEKQQIIEAQVKALQMPDSTKMTLNIDKGWLEDALKKSNFEAYHINRIVYSRPELVKYNVSMLPEPPKQYIITTDPTKATLSLEEFVIKNPVDVPSAAEVTIKKWLSRFEASFQFSQAYISENWYQGGNSNLNLMGNLFYAINLNTKLYPKLLFENSIRYKFSLNSAPQDTLRSYNISEDLFQLNSKFGLKAAKNWYYSTTLQFKTQVFKNYLTNTYDLKAAFLTPGELNVGLGMTYNKVTKDNSARFDVSIAPLSYNMKICFDESIKPESLGMEAGKMIQNKIGSNVEGKLFWKLHTNITLTSRLFVFTDYSYIQGDFENTFNFSINKYLSTQLYLHLRYDTSVASPATDWKYWQFKEILSLGFNYKI